MFIGIRKLAYEDAQDAYEAKRSEVWNTDYYEAAKESYAREMMYMQQQIEEDERRRAAGYKEDRVHRVLSSSTSPNLTWVELAMLAMIPFSLNAITKFAASFFE